MNSPIIFLHGFTGSSNSWSNFLNKINFSSVAIDLPGHGNNKIKNLTEKYNLNDWEQEFKSTLKIKKLNEVHLCGYSMGGRLALSFAIKYPNLVKSLIIISSTAGIKNINDRKNRIIKDNKLSKEILKNYKKFINKWENLDFFSKQKSRNYSEYLHQHEIRKNQNPNQLAFILKHLSTGEMPNYWNIISSLKIPTLMICGEEDKKYMEINKKMNFLIKNSKLKVIANSGHAPHIEQPKRLAQIINKFYRKLI